MMDKLIRTILSLNFNDDHSLMSHDFRYMGHIKNLAIPLVVKGVTFHHSKFKRQYRCTHCGLEAIIIKGFNKGAISFQTDDYLTRTVGKNIVSDRLIYEFCDDIAMRRALA